MFEESLLAPRKGGRGPRDRLAGVLITLLFHGILGLAIYHGRFTVKILPFDERNEEVREVVLAPALMVAIPRIVGGRDLAADPAEALGTPRPSATARVEPPAEAEAEPTGEGEGPGDEVGGEAAGPPGPLAAIPSLSSRFRESLAVRGRSALTIPLAPPGTPPGPPGISGRAPLPDFSQYGRGATGSGGGGSGGGSGSGGGGRGRQRIGISVPYKGYDLLPWATVVVERLQLHWTLPAVSALPDIARISFVVVIKRNGDLESIEILEGTTVEVLDRAALEAIQAGLPFPALPGDFPGDLLEMTFEFVYND